MTSVAPLRLRAGATAVAVGGVGTPQLQVNGVFATTTRTMDPKDYYTPGNENPAVSTADYYHMAVCQYLRPYDLDTMGSAGAAVKAANGGNRYVWFVASDHPAGGGGLWRDSAGFKMGFSNDPGIFPPFVLDIIPQNNQYTGVASPVVPGIPTGITVSSDMAPSALVYNPDDATFPFYLYTQGLGINTFVGTQSIMWKSSDLFTWNIGGWSPKTIDDAAVVLGGNNPLTSFQWVERLGTGNWKARGTVGSVSRIGEWIWTGTNGTDFAYASTVYNVGAFPTVTLTLSGNALSASSAIFSSSDVNTKAVGGSCSSPPPIGLVNGFPKTFTMITGFTDSSHVTVANGAGASLSAEAHPFEIGPIARRDGPAGGIVGGQSGYYPGMGSPTIVISGQDYELALEDARHSGQPTDDGMHGSLAPQDALRNISQVLQPIRVASFPAPVYPGPYYPLGIVGYHEEGILHVYTENGVSGPFGTNPLPHVGAAAVGSISGSTLTLTSVSGLVTIGAIVATTTTWVGQVLSFGTGTGGTGTYTIENSASTSAGAGSTIFLNGGTNYPVADSAQTGGLRQQFVQHHTIATDSRAASRSAPFGVACSCSNNVVTISWMTTPLGTGAETQAYNIYKGTTAGSQTTALSGNPYSGTSTTDTPTPNQVWYYKVVKVSGGIEQTTKFRVVHTYVG